MSAETRATNRGAPARPKADAGRGRRLVRALSVVFIAAGTLLLIEAGLTVLWQEPITAYFTHRTQNRLSHDLDKLRKQPATRAEIATLTALSRDRQLPFLAASWEKRTKDGDAVGRISIPKIDASFVVVKGTSAADLRKGPGFYDGRPFPGSGRTSAIAGHRTTYLAPFRHIDDLRPGDRITVTMPYATFSYAVERTRIVPPSDVSVVKDVGRERLVLTACHPLFSASKRIVVFARLVRARPAAALARLGRPSDALKAGPRRGR
jgi:sortase A